MRFSRFILLLIPMLIAGCFKGPVPRLAPQPALTAPTRVLVDRLQKADGYIAGTITKIEPDWTYDDPCGLLAQAMNRCDGTATYQVTVEGNGVKKDLYIFVPQYGYIPLGVGQKAVFIWHPYYAVEYGPCKARGSMSAQSCPADKLPSLLSSDDVAAFGDSALVGALFDGRTK